MIRKRAIDSRDGIYLSLLDQKRNPDHCRASHHYETMAFSGYLSETIKMGALDLRL